MWNDSDLDEDEDCNHPVASLSKQWSSAVISAVRVFTVFVLTWQSIFRIANVAAGILFQFFSCILNHLAAVTESDYLRATNVFPNTLIKAQCLIQLKNDGFRQYVCCPKCFATYDFEECLEWR